MSPVYVDALRRLFDLDEPAPASTPAPASAPEPAPAPAPSCGSDVAPAAPAPAGPAAGLGGAAPGGAEIMPTRPFASPAQAS